MNCISFLHLAQLLSSEIPQTLCRVLIQLGRPRKAHRGGDREGRPGISLGEGCSRQRDSREQGAVGGTEAGMGRQAGPSV